MYTRIYHHDGTSYVVETKYFDIRDIEEGMTYVQNLTSDDLANSEILILLQSDAESANHHSLIRQYQTICNLIVDVANNNSVSVEQAKTIVHAFMIGLLNNGGLCG